MTEGLINVHFLCIASCLATRLETFPRSSLPTGNPYVVVLPSTPRSAVIGQMVTISYTVATSFQLTLEHTFNGSVIPDPVPSPNNDQLRQYSFTANTSSEGTYRLSLSKLVRL